MVGEGNLDIYQMIGAVRGYQMSENEMEEQRRSFAFGNANLANPRVTRELVDSAADSLPVRYSGK